MLARAGFDPETVLDRWTWARLEATVAAVLTATREERRWHLEAALVAARGTEQSIQQLRDALDPAPPHQRATAQLPPTYQPLRAPASSPAAPSGRSAPSQAGREAPPLPVPTNGSS